MALKQNFIHSWSRRTTIAALSGVGGLAVLRKFGGNAIEVDPAVMDLTRRVVAVLGHEAQLDRSAVALHASTLETLIAEIFTRSKLTANDLRSAPEQLLQQGISQSIETDYRCGKLNIMNGWWISHTEARCLDLIERVCG